MEREKLLLLLAGARYNDYASKYGDCGYNLGDCKGVHTYIDAYYYSYDRLYIGVHSYERRAQQLLTYWNEEVGDKGGTYNQERQF